SRVLPRVVDAHNRALREPARETIVERSARREPIYGICVVIQSLRNFRWKIRKESTTRGRRPQQRMSKLGDEHCREALVCSEVSGEIDEVEARGEIGLRIDRDVDVRMQ